MKRFITLLLALVLIISGIPVSLAPVSLADELPTSESEEVEVIVTQSPEETGPMPTEALVAEPPEESMPDSTEESAPETTEEDFIDQESFETGLTYSLRAASTLEITAHPANVSAKSGASVSFTVSAQGSNLSYQWQTLEVGKTTWVNTGMSGNKTAKLSFTTAASLDGRQYRCAVSDGTKTVYSNAAKLTLTDVLKITAHPANVSVKSGASVSFTVSAQGSNLSYQWQTLEVGKTTWVNTGISGNKTAKLSFTTAASLDGRQYRCAVSDGSKTVYSNPAKLTLTDVLKITAQPANVSAKSGASVSFSVSAQGSNLSYQWQTLEVGKTTWVNTGMSGNKTAKLSFTTAASLDGRQYRCVVSDGSNTVYSNAAKLTLTDVLKITAQPANVSVKSGASVSYTVSAQGNNLSYQWQTLAVGSTTWVNTGMNGNKTAKLSFTTAAVLDGRKYRCAVSDGTKTVYSNAAKLTLTDVLKITAQPANVSVKTGASVSFTVSAKGSNLSYQWQTLSVGSTTWVNTGMNGNKTAKLSFTTAASLDGRKYRCAVSDGSKTVYSNTATLTLTDVLKITAQPTSVSVKSGASVSFSVSAQGSNLSYQWQTLAVGSSTWVNTGMNGNKTAKLSFITAATLDGRQYRCAVSDGSKTVYSNAATLTLTDVLKITAQPTNVSAKSGASVSFSVSAQGSNLSYQWQTLSVGSTNWVNTGMNGNKTEKLSFTTAATLDGRQYRCAVSDGTKTVYSNAATLTLTDVLKITSQPANVSAKSGASVSFTVSAQGSNLSYQWQTLAVGSTTWVNTGMNGNKTAKLSFTTAATLDGRQYRCAVSDGTKTVYSNAAKLTLTDVAGGKETEEFYDNQGNYTGKKVSYTDANGKTIIEYYGAQDNFIKKQVSYKNADGKYIFENYDAQGNYTGKYISTDGIYVDEEYDAQDKLKYKYVYYTDASGNEIEEEYNAQGKLTYKYTAYTNGKYTEEYYDYDAQGKLTRKFTRDADKKWIQEDYDSKGNLERKFITYTGADGKSITESYDAQGNYTGKDVSCWDADGTRFTECYDAQGNLESKVTVDANEKVVQEFYDAQGQLTGKYVSYVDASGKYTIEWYDAQGYITSKKVSDADGNVILREEFFYFYDAQGQLTSNSVTFKGAVIITPVWGAPDEYLGIMASYTNADGKKITEHYDAEGNYTGKYVSNTDADGKYITEIYDAQGNYTGKSISYTDADGKKIWEDYNAQGYLTYRNTTDANGKSISENYDAQGKLRVKYVSYTDAAGKKISEKYNAQGNYKGKEISYTDANGKEIREYYDAQGNLSDVFSFYSD